jgi:hypothetical protein
MDNSGDVVGMTVLEKKLWFAHEINSNQNTGWRLNKSHLVHQRSAQRYAEKVRKGKMVYERGGRPPAIDNEGLELLVTFIVENPTAIRRDIVAKIREVYLQTWNRRLNGHLEGFVGVGLPTKLSNRSIERYIRRLHGQV